MMVSDVCLSRTSDTIFKVERSNVRVTGGGGILWRPPAQLVCIYCVSTVLVVRFYNKYNVEKLQVYVSYNYRIAGCIYH